MKNAIFTKKALLLLLVMSMLLVFVGCSKGGETLTTASTEPSSGVETEPSGITDQAEVFVKPENYASVLLVTINPQIRLYLDADGIVLAVEAVNKDAEEIKESSSFEGESYEAAIEKIITKSEEKGYIKSNAVISVEITEAKDPTVDTTVMLDKITVTVSQTASKLEIKVEIETEDKTTAESQPDVNATDPTQDATTAPTTSSTVTTPTTPTQCSHTYKDATCTAPKTCSKCGTTAGSAAGHCWNDATCTTAKTCSKCGATEGNAAGHSYKDATCTAPKICSRCGTTEGNVADHKWTDATCQAPKTCSMCQKTEGAPVAHIFDSAGKCQWCKQILPVSPSKLKNRTYTLTKLTASPEWCEDYGLVLEQKGISFDTSSIWFGKYYREIAYCDLCASEHNSIWYNGKEYCPFAGPAGDDLIYQISGDHIVIGNLVLELLSNDTLRVVSISNWTGVSVGDIFI